MATMKIVLLSATVLHVMVSVTSAVQDKYKPYPFDCTKFYQCTKDSGYMNCFLMNCGPGTAFNPKIEDCDWPTNVPLCQQLKEKKISPEEFGRQEYWLVEDPKDPTVFYRCNGERCKGFKCPPLYTFSVEAKQCVYFENV